MLRALVLLVFLASPPMAQDSPLASLDAGDAARGWEAVGRLDLDGRGFCTGALVAPDLVLTAAHCLYNRSTGARIDAAGMVFMAGWRHGRAAAYRGVRRALAHPDYAFAGAVTADRVRSDLALLELEQPIRSRSIAPFEIGPRPREGQRIAVVSYARGRAEAPSLQEVCRVLSRRDGVLVMSCDVDFGASGAPVFSLEGGRARIVSVVSAMAEKDGRQVALGTEAMAPLARLRAVMAPAPRDTSEAAPQVLPPGTRPEIGAKFARP